MTSLNILIILTNANDFGSHAFEVVDSIQGGFASNGGGDEDNVVGNGIPVTQATNDVRLHPPQGVHWYRVLTAWSENRTLRNQNQF